jgi:hypothetical protein
MMCNKSALVNPIRAMIFATLGCVAMTSSLADGRTAVDNLLGNLARANRKVVLDGKLNAAPTLVKGLYLISNAQGKFMGYTNELGTLLGDWHGFNVISTKGELPRPATQEENRELRAEFLKAIDYEKLIKIRFGNGGDRKVLLLSAVDCPACRNLELMLQKNAEKINTTFYVVPSSLQPIKSGGMQSWQAVAHIWCAENGSLAWSRFVSTRVLPLPRDCQFSNPVVAEEAANALSDVLNAVNGVRAKGVPAFVREDGVAFSISAPETEMLFQPVEKPLANIKPMRWLIGGKRL